MFEKYRFTLVDHILCMDFKFKPLLVWNLTGVGFQRLMLLGRLQADSLCLTFFPDFQYPTQTKWGSRHSSRRKRFHQCHTWPHTVSHVVCTLCFFQRPYWNCGTFVPSSCLLLWQIMFVYILSNTSLAVHKLNWASCADVHSEQTLLEEKQVWVCHKLSFLIVQKDESYFIWSKQRTNRRGEEDVEIAVLQEVSWWAMSSMSYPSSIFVTFSFCL